MKRKLLSIVILAVVVCFNISTGTNTVFVTAAELDVANINSNYSRNVNRSMEINNELNDNYLIRTDNHNGKDFSVFRDDFAGIYVDEQGILNIAVVGESQIRMQQESRLAGNVVFQQFEFSYNFLQKTMNAVEDIMEMHCINAVGIDDKLNVVFIEMNDENDVSPIIEHLRRENLYDKDAITFEVNPNADIQTNANVAYSGESLWHWTETPGTYARGTIGVNAICNITGRLGVLTNEHVALANGNPSPDNIYGGHWNESGFSNGWNGIYIGNGLRGRNGGSIDAAFVPFNNQENWEISPYSKYNTNTYTNVRLGNENQIVRGNNVRRIGQTTGITTGEIRSTNVTQTISGTKITNTFRYTNDGLAGDSGGPVYFDDGTNLFLIGLNYASTDVFLGGRQGMAIRMSNIMKTVANGGLDVTPITNDSFVTNNLTSSTVSLNGINFNPSGALATPTFLNGRTVTRIGDSAFYDHNQLTQVTVPSTVTHIGSNAFLNTNSARIDLAGRTSSPSTFDANWNPSNNPVYLNGVECLHTSKTLTYISGGKHGLMCNQCRTTTNVTPHPAINLWRDYYQHHSKCSCGLNQLMAHVVSSSDPGYPYKTCLYCGGPAKDAIGQYDKGSSIITVVPSLFIKEYFGNGSYILQNGIYVISDEDLSSFYDGTLILPEKCDDCHEHFELHNCVDCMYN